MNNLKIKRILKDINNLKKNDLENHGIYFKTNDENIHNLKILIIGTKQTPYEYGYYFFDINLPEDYPFAPPKIQFCTQNNTTRFNHNLYINGKVCLSLINTWAGPKWTACNSLTSVLLSLQAIVFIENPLHNEPGFENDMTIRNINYNKILYYENINTAIYNMIKNPPHGFYIFDSIIKTKFIENYDNIINNIKLIKNKEEIINAHIYNMKTKINYNILKNNLKNLYKQLNL